MMAGLGRDGLSLEPHKVLLPVDLSRERAARPNALRPGDGVGEGAAETSGGSALGPAQTDYPTLFERSQEADRSRMQAGARGRAASRTPRTLPATRPALSQS